MLWNLSSDELICFISTLGNTMKTKEEEKYTCSWLLYIDQLVVAFQWELLIICSCSFRCFCPRHSWYFRQNIAYEVIDRTHRLSAKEKWQILCNHWKISLEIVYKCFCSYLSNFKILQMLQLLAIYLCFRSV